MNWVSMWWVILGVSILLFVVRVWMVVIRFFVLVFLSRKLLVLVLSVWNR